ncbi:MAG TPA: TonB-dependent receptor [Lacunisphaera sp.]|nr:TonB-dependent receptor [Lacunisphaera sp.]
MRFLTDFTRRLGIGLGVLLAAPAFAAPVDFNLPPQSAATALLAFSQQARMEVLFSYDDLKAVTAGAVVGFHEPKDAIDLLLKNTGFAAHRNFRGKFIVTRAPIPTGSIEGRVLLPTGEPARGIVVALADTRLKAATDDTGTFVLPAVPPGSYRLVTGGAGYQMAEKNPVIVASEQSQVLDPLRLQLATEVTVLEPYLVKDQDDRLLIGEGVGAAPRRAAGNLDLPRTEDNGLPFTIFTREQIARSGVVQLNEFFQRELLDGDSNTPPPEQNGNQSSFVAGSSNLSLRGYGASETVVLVNGRRLPETITDSTGQLGAPDVNLVPLSLVQQIEVLPTSASALYSGNAVGGVINIVLRPEADGTEVRTTYTNALGGFDAPQTSVSLQHSRTLLDGKLRLRLNATFTRTEPAVESELGLQRVRLARDIGLLPRATPNVESASLAPLFGPGTPYFTSVAPGKDGGGLAAFAGRQGVRSQDSFDSPGGLAASFDSLDYPYGRRQRRTVFFGSAVYDVRPWLQLGLDASYSRNVIHRGYDVFPATLTLAAPSALSPSSSFNPFDQEVLVALNETTPKLGQNYNEAQLDSWSIVGGALVKTPRGWQIAADVQYARNVAKYRGLVRADADRWQELVDDGLYNPLRDTQVFGPPPEFYDRVLVYYGAPNRFVTLGDYNTLEGAVRVTHEALPLPTGLGTVNAGTDYRRSELAPYLQEPRFADGTPAGEIVQWSGRTLERISVFGELQAPLLPKAYLPKAIKRIETDLAVRYIISAQSNETNVAPTVGFKVDLVGGFSFRSSYTTSNRFPSPIMSRPIALGSGDASGAEPTALYDPLRNESYVAESKIAINDSIRPESAVTQTAGLVWSRGKTHRFRASLDFADTRKTNEIIDLSAQNVLNLENLFPDRVLRSTTPPADRPPTPLRVTTVFTGTVNAANRHSQNWNVAFDYAWHGFRDGVLELRGRWVYFQKYDRQFPNAPVVDELGAPDGSAKGLLRHRLSLGSAWSNKNFGFGMDAHFLGSRTLPVIEWAPQGSDRIKAYWQFDAYGQADLTRWLPRRSDKFRLGAQLRINNLSNYEFPKYVNDPSGTGRQPYGDWRGRTYSFSLTASY